MILISLSFGLFHVKTMKNKVDTLSLHNKAIYLTARDIPMAYTTKR